MPSDCRPQCDMALSSLAFGAVWLLGLSLQGWTSDFSVNTAELVTSGRNPYFVLEPGYTLTLEGQESGKPVRLVITVLNETKTIEGVPTRVVEERETKNGEL